MRGEPGQGIVGHFRGIAGCHGGPYAGVALARVEIHDQRERVSCARRAADSADASRAALRRLLRIKRGEPALLPALRGPRGGGGDP